MLICITNIFQICVCWVYNLFRLIYHIINNTIKRPLLFLCIFRHPDISYASKKKSKSKVSVVSLSLEDPASNAGMIKISEKLVPFVPSYPSGRKQKTVVFGDQGYVERGDNLVCKTQFSSYHDRSWCFLGSFWGKAGREKAGRALIFAPGVA